MSSDEPARTVTKEEEMACTRTSPGPSGGAGMSLGRLVAQGRPSGSHKLRDDATRLLDAVAPL